MANRFSSGVSFWLRFASAAAFLGTAALTVDAHAQNIERGRDLYENHCQKCHTAKVHARKDRSVLSVGELRDIVNRWQVDQALRWREDEIEDVVQYLARVRYPFTTSR